MGQDIRGYQTYFLKQFVAGSAAATVIPFSGITNRIDLVHLTGSNAFFTFDTGLTPYGNVGSYLMLSSGNTITLPIRAGSMYCIGSAGSPIGASTSTIRVQAYY